jgi:hypothetical protein
MFELNVNITDVAVRVTTLNYGDWRRLHISRDGNKGEDVKWSHCTMHDTDRTKQWITYAYIICRATMALAIVDIRAQQDLGTLITAPTSNGVIHSLLTDSLLRYHDR